MNGSVIVAVASVLFIVALGVSIDVCISASMRKEYDARIKKLENKLTEVERKAHQ